MRAFWLVPAVMAGLAWVMLDVDSGVPAWLRLRDELAASEARIAVLSARTETLQREIRALEHDPFAIERAIREELGLARPGEHVVRFGARQPVE